MKSKILHVAVLWVCLMAGVGLRAQWQPVGSIAFSPGTAELTSLVLSKDTPVLAFKDDAHNGQLTVMKFNGTAWQTLGTPGFTYPVNQVSAAEDSATGTIYVAYVDSTDSFSVVKWTGSAWSYVGGYGFLEGQEDELTIAIAADGTPYIAYRDGNQSYKASVQKFDGTSWGLVGPVNFSPASLDVLALAIDQSGTPYVAQADGNTDTMFVQRFNGSNWITLGAYGFSRSAGSTPISMDFGPDNLPYVALTSWTLNGPDGGASVWKYNGSSWGMVGGTFATAGDARAIVLKVSHSGIPVIAYTDNANSSQISVSYYAGGVWSLVGSPDFSTQSVETPSLAISSSNNLYVGYEDDGNGHASTVQEYIIGAAINHVANISSFKLYPNPNNGQFQINVQTTEPDQIQLSLVNTLGQTVWQNNAGPVNGNYTTNVNAGNLPAGVYILQAKTNNGTENRLVEVK